MRRMAASSGRRGITFAKPSSGTRSPGGGLVKPAKSRVILRSTRRFSKVRGSPRIAIVGLGCTIPRASPLLPVPLDERRIHLRLDEGGVIEDLAVQRDGRLDAFDD